MDMIFYLGVTSPEHGGQHSRNMHYAVSGVYILPLPDQIRARKNSSRSNTNFKDGIPV